MANFGGRAELVSRHLVDRPAVESEVDLPLLHACQASTRTVELCAIHHFKSLDDLKQGTRNGANKRRSARALALLSSGPDLPDDLVARGVSGGQ